MLPSNLFPYPPALSLAISTAFHQGALLIERQGFVQVNACGMVILTGRFAFGRWLVTLESE